MKSIPLIFILTGLLFFLWGESLLQTPLQSHWQSHIEKTLPQHIQSGVANIRWFPLTPQAKKVLPQLEEPFATEPHHPYIIDIIFMVFEEKSHQWQFIFQYSVLERDTKNLIWEGGDTFLLPQQ